MNLISVLLIAVGLSMDAFAVSICKGLAMQKITPKNALTVGAWFGAFQGIMPMIGYCLGAQFERIVNTFAPWIAFVLLALIGANMIRESRTSDDEPADASLDFREMFMLAVATSIDALAVGVSYAMVPVNIISASAFMNALLASGLTAMTTFAISAAGVKVGSAFGTRYKSKAELVGGIILILIGVEILLKHFGVI